MIRKHILFVGILLGILALSAEAQVWSGPTAAPPGANVSTPLNVSNTAQSKAAGLILNTGGAPYGLLVPAGKVGIGTAATPNGLFEVFAGAISAFTVLSNGNVGLGVANPATKVAISGGLQVSDDLSSCTGPKSGAIRYHAGGLEVCNGVNWVGASGIDITPGANVGYCMIDTWYRRDQQNNLFHSSGCTSAIPGSCNQAEISAANSYYLSFGGYAHWGRMPAAGAPVCSCSQGFNLESITGGFTPRAGYNIFGPHDESYHMYSINVCRRTSDALLANPFPTIQGCTNSTAVNYDPYAGQDNGSCHWNGCMVQYSPNDGIEASNYEPKATNPVVACIYRGCTDPGANNYQQDATEDDNSCDYGGGEEE